MRECPTGTLTRSSSGSISREGTTEELTVELATPRTKGDIIEFSDTEESESDESINVTDIKPNVKSLPTTVEGLRRRFHELYTEFTRQRKHEHRNELVFLLDELLRQEGINREEYKHLNSILAESLGSGIGVGGEEPLEKDNAEDEVKSRVEKINTLIRSIGEYSIQDDKKDLLELMHEFRKDVGEDFLDTVLELKELVDVYLLEEFLAKESIRIKIDEVRRKLEGSAIFKPKQHRLKVLLDDIAQNRHRVQAILTRMADAYGEEAISFTLIQLSHEELLSEEQHLKIADALLEEELNSSWSVDVIKHKVKVLNSYLED